MKRLRITALVLSLILLPECIYCVTVFTDWVPPLSRLRNQFLETALGTMNHKWLATALIPGDIVLEIQKVMEQDRLDQAGQNSSRWEQAEIPENRSFFELFPELEESALRAWSPVPRAAASTPWVPPPRSARKFWPATALTRP